MNKSKLRTNKKTSELSKKNIVIIIPIQFRNGWMMTQNAIELKRYRMRTFWSMESMQYTRDKKIFRKMRCVYTNNIVKCWIVAELENRQIDIRTISRFRSHPSSCSILSASFIDILHYWIKMFRMILREYEIRKIYIRLMTDIVSIA